MTKVRNLVWSGWKKEPADASTERFRFTVCCNAKTHGYLAKQEIVGTCTKCERVVVRYNPETQSVNYLKVAE